jgi:multisubunit Na+/H+ antiporter MnhB subunit
MFLIGLIITAVGFILALAVHPENPGSVNVNTVGWILVVVGIVAFLADLLLWSSRGPGYLRRTTVVHDPGYGGAYPAQRGYVPRRRVIEEEEAGPPGPGY